MDALLQMRVYAAVVDAGGFTAAADALRMPKATVSRHVSALEARLGVRLLHRTTRRLSTTEEGAVFHARCQELLAGVDEAEAEVAARAGHATGRLRIAVPVSFGLIHLAPLWPAFMAAHPRVSLEVGLSDRIVDLVDEGWDLAVRIGRLADSTLVSRRLASTRLVACASPAYLRGRDAPTHPSELAGHEVLGYTLSATGDVWSFDGPGGPVSVRVFPRLHANSGDVCRAAALAGRGIVLQPTFLVGADLREGTLVEVLPGWRAAEIGIHAVHPTRRHVPQKVRVAIDFLVQALREPAWPD